MDPGVPAAVNPAATPANMLLDWAAGLDPDGPRLLRLLGGPGSGKSRLLAELLQRSESVPGARIHATVPVGSQTAETVAWELGRQLGYGPLHLKELVARVAADPRPLTVLLPDLHLAGAGLPDGGAGSQPSGVAERVVTPLLQLPHVRIAAETGTNDLLTDTVALDIELLPGSGHVTPGDTDWHADRPVPVPRAVVPAARTADAPSPSGNRAGPEEHERNRRLAAAGVEERGHLLADPGYLVHGSPVAVTAALADPRTRAPGRLRRAWATAAPALTTYGLNAVERAALLHTAALTTDEVLAEYLRPLAATHTWCARWSRPIGGATALALTPEGLALADAVGRVLLLHPATGVRTGVLPTEPGVRPEALVTSCDSVLLCTGTDGTMHALAPDASSSAVAKAVSPAIAKAAARHNSRTLADPATRPTALAAGAATPLAVACQDGHVHLWDLDDTSTDPTSYQAHHLPITAVAVVKPDGGPLLAATGSLDGTVRLWDSHSGTVMPEPVERRAAIPSALAATDTATGPVLAIAWSDHRIHLWHLLSGRLSAFPWLAPVESLVFDEDGTLYIATTTTLTATTLQPLPW